MPEETLEPRYTDLLDRAMELLDRPPPKKDDSITALIKNATKAPLDFTETLQMISGTQQRNVGFSGAMSAINAQRIEKAKAEAALEQEHQKALQQHGANLAREVNTLLGVVGRREDARLKRELDKLDAADAKAHRDRMFGQSLIRTKTAQTRANIAAAQYEDNKAFKDRSEARDLRQLELTERHRKRMQDLGITREMNAAEARKRADAARKEAADFRRLQMQWRKEDRAAAAANTKRRIDLHAEANAHRVQVTRAKSIDSFIAPFKNFMAKGALSTKEYLQILGGLNDEIEAAGATTPQEVYAAGIKYLKDNNIPLPRIIVSRGRTIFQVDPESGDFKKIAEGEPSGFRYSRIGIVKDERGDQIGVAFSDKMHKEDGSPSPIQVLLHGTLDAVPMKKGWEITTPSSQDRRILTADKLEKMRKGLVEERIQIGRLDTYFKSSRLAGQGWQVLANRMTAAFKTFFLANNLNQQEFNTLIQQNQLQGLIGVAKSPVGMTGFLSNQDVERIIRYLGGDISAFRDPAVVENAIRAIVDEKIQRYNLAIQVYNGQVDASDAPGFVKLDEITNPLPPGRTIKLDPRHQKEYERRLRQEGIDPKTGKRIK